MEVRTMATAVESVQKAKLTAEHHLGELALYIKPLISGNQVL